MSIRCPECGRIAGRGYEIGHAMWCPLIKGTQSNICPIHNKPMMYCKECIIKMQINNLKLQKKKLKDKLKYEMKALECGICWGIALDKINEVFKDES